MPFDPELTPGARNAVQVCLRVQPAEKVTVITDEVTLEIARRWCTNWKPSVAATNAWVIEDVARRPLADFPLRLRKTWRLARLASSRCRRR